MGEIERWAKCPFCGRTFNRMTEEATKLTIDGALRFACQCVDRGLRAEKEQTPPGRGARITVPTQGKPNGDGTEKGMGEPTIGKILGEPRHG